MDKIFRGFPPRSGGSVDWLSTDPAGTVLREGFFGAGGLVKVWSGAAFVAKPVKVWTGAAWVQKPLKRWSGAAWV